MTLSYSMENVSSIFMKHCLIAEINWWMWDCSRVRNKWLKCDIPWSFHIRDSEFQICGFKISPTTTDHDIFGRESAVTQFENLLTDQKKKFKHIRNEKKNIQETNDSTTDFTNEKTWAFFLSLYLFWSAIQGRFITTQKLLPLN